MKASLEYNLPQERSEFNIASKAMDWYVVLYDLDQKLREWLKYGHKFRNADDSLEAVKKELHELMDAHVVSFDEVE